MSKNKDCVTPHYLLPIFHVPFISKIRKWLAKNNSPTLAKHHTSFPPPSPPHHLIPTAPPKSPGIMPVSTRSKRGSTRGRRNKKSLLSRGRKRPHPSSSPSPPAADKSISAASNEDVSAKCTSAASDEDAAPAFDQDAAPAFDEDAAPAFDEDAAAAFNEHAAAAFDEDAPAAFDEDRPGSSVAAFAHSSPLDIDSRSESSADEPTPNATTPVDPVNERALAQLKEVDALLFQFRTTDNESSGEQNLAEQKYIAQQDTDQPSRNWPPLQYKFHWVYAKSISSYATQGDVLGDGNCLLYAFRDGLMHQFPNFCHDDKYLADFFEKKEHFKSAIRLRMAIHQYATTNMARLFDRSDPCIITESGLPDFTVFNNRKVYSKITGQLIRDGTRAFRYELGKIYSERFFREVTGNVLPSHYWLIPYFVVPLLCMMFEVTIIVVGKPCFDPKSGLQQVHTLGTEIYFYRDHDNRVQKICRTLNIPPEEIVTAFPKAVTIYYDGINHYNRVLPNSDGFLSGVPELTEKFLIPPASDASPTIFQIQDSPTPLNNRSVLDENKTSAAEPEDLCSPNKYGSVKSNLSEIVCVDSSPTEDSSTPNMQTPHLHRSSTMLPSPLQRRILNKPRESLLSHKTTSSDGTVWLHHKSEGLFEVELSRDEFYELVDVRGAGMSIETLEWKTYPGLHDLSSLITTHLGKIPVFLHHLDPRYYATSVITRYKKKKDGSVNQLK